MTNLFRRFSVSYQRFKTARSPQFNLALGFLIYTIVGWLLLCLPFLHKTNISPLDNLFTATSAVSTTGLVTVGMSDYTLVGQMIVASLFQLGGIGYMTLTTYFLLFTTRRLTSWHKKIIGTEFTMPDTIRINDFIRSVIIFTLVMESLGAIAFYWAFRQTGMPGGEALWSSIFHSISAFCTAGFGLFSDSFEGYAENGLINTIISVLAISGSLGFIVITDVWYRLTGRSRQLSFTTRIVTYGFLFLLTAGTTLIYFTEPIVHATGEKALMKSFFAAMTAMTTVGFNTVTTGELNLSILLFVTFLMYLGASPSGTAGGMKITTLTAMLAVLKSRLKGSQQITFLRREIPAERILVATATFVLYTSLVGLFTFLLSFTEAADFDRLLFEVASALGTVGLSAGLTGSLTTFGKVIFILIMFVGRVGVLTFGFALVGSRKVILPETCEGEDLAV